jgi:hypothetical protein
VWAQARAFAAGKHWLKWSRRQRRLVLPADNRYRDRYSVEEIGQYRLTAVGELSHDDMRPTLLFRQDQIDSEEIAAQINDALAYAWDEEIDADEILMDLKFALVDLGTAALRCRFDPTRGPVVGHLPAGADGAPVTDQAMLDHLERHGQMPDGSLPKFHVVHEGAIRWELAAPENLLVPAGVEYQRDFPWEIWQRPVAIDALVEEYGDIAAGLKEESLSALQMLGSREMSDQASDPDTDNGQAGKLSRHVLVYTCYERPTVGKPQGEMVVLAGTDELRPLEAPRPLPYQGPDGTWRSGITYFHYNRVPGRFWGRGLVEVLKDPQRMIDRRRTQISETLDRGQPKVFVEKGSIDGGVTGSPVEIIELEKNTAAPVFHQGLAPGPWMQAEVESCREDLARASGIQSVTLGENPTNVGTYSQLALLRESDQIKRLPGLKRFQSGVGELVENTVYDIRRYWGHRKQIVVAGETEGMLQASVFDATKTPVFFKVEIAKGAAKPLTQGAKLQLVTDIATYSLNSRQPLPTRWYYDSLLAGEPMPLPEDEKDDQVEKAQTENVMLAQGQPVEVAYYDPALVHIPEHRSMQIQATLAGRHDVADQVELHIQQHLAMEQQKAAQQQPPAPGGEPPAGGLPVPPPPMPMLPGGPAAAPPPAPSPF